MPKFKDLTGMKFGRLTVIKRAENNKFGQIQWLCRCECGNTRVIKGSSLGKPTKSCGCLAKEKAQITGKESGTHYKTGTRLYNIWANIKQRCFNEKNESYRNYGKRGITVCSEWYNDFNEFYKWAMENGYKDTLTIDRINVNGNYEPSNCRWADIREQENNRTNNHYATFNNETHTLSEWSEILGINCGTLYSRLNRDGWSVEKAFTTSTEKKGNNKVEKHFVEYNGQTHSLREWSEILKVEYNTLYNRIIKGGWTAERAFTTPAKGKEQKNA